MGVATDPEVTSAIEAAVAGDLGNSALRIHLDGRHCAPVGRAG